MARKKKSAAAKQTADAADKLAPELAALDGELLAKLNTQDETQGRSLRALHGDYQAARSVILRRHGVACRERPDTSPFDAGCSTDAMLSVLEDSYRSVADLAFKSGLRIDQMATIDAARAHAVAATRRLRADGRGDVPTLAPLDSAVGVEQSLGSLIDYLKKDAPQKNFGKESGKVLHAMRAAAGEDDELSRLCAELLMQMTPQAHQAPKSMRELCREIAANADDANALRQRFYSLQRKVATRLNESD